LMIQQFSSEMSQAHSLRICTNRLGKRWTGLQPLGVLETRLMDGLSLTVGMVCDGAGTGINAKDF
jgi:hypothetical protein